MRKSQYYTKGLIAICSLFFSTLVAAEAVYVVVHKENNELIDASTIRDIYQDKKSHWSSGKPILVFELPVSSHVREKFSQKILNASAMTSQRQWSNRFVNNTIKNEVKIKPAKLVSRFVNAKPTAIGYVTKEELNDINNAKVILVID